MQALVVTPNSSRRVVRRVRLSPNAVTINGENNPILNTSFNDEDRLFGRYTLLRRGKKNYCS